jgi:hypothetical protein
MSYRKLFIGIAVILLLIAAYTLLLPDTDLSEDTTSPQGLSVVLVGFTNAVGAMQSCSYAGTNATTGRFAVLRVENSRYRDFQCDWIGLYLHQTDAPKSEPELVRLLGFTPFAVAGKGGVMVAIPEPKSEARWHVAIHLVPSKSWSRYPQQVRNVLRRIGVDTRDSSYIVGSKIYK